MENYKSPEIKKQERSKEWENKKIKVSERMDEIEGKMDEGVCETVAGLNLFNFPTTGSCEGHLDWGISCPWVEIESLNEPNERFENENEIYQKTANENGVTVDQLKKEDALQKVLRKCRGEILNNPEKPEYIDWVNENKKLKTSAQKIIDNYYIEKEKEIPTDPQIKLTDIGASFRIYTGSEEDYCLEDEEKEEFDEKQKSELEERLSQYQAEMKNFTAFLKEKYLELGKDYLKKV